MLGYRGVLQQKRASSLELQPSSGIVPRRRFPSPGYPSAPAFVAFIKQRLLEKSERLAIELDGLSAAGSRDVVAAACYSINWERLTRAYGAILTPEHLEEEAWDVVSSLGAAIEPDATRCPLRPVEKFLAQQFARGIRAALGIEVPEAYELTARLYGFPDWTATVGPRAPMFPDVPLYHYCERTTAEGMRGFLEPNAAARAAAEDIEAATVGLRADARAEIAMQCLGQRDDLLAAAAIACTSALEAGRPGQALFCAGRTIRVIQPVLSSPVAPLSNQTPSNWYWRQVLSSWLIAIKKVAADADITEQQVLDATRCLDAFEPASGAWETDTELTSLARRSLFRLVTTQR
jgi:hypothetical protein